MDVVAADLEGTLTTGATWRGLGRYLLEHGQKLKYRLFFLNHLPGALLARRGLIDIDVQRARWMVDMAKLLKGVESDRLQEICEWIVEHELWAKRRLEVLSELVVHLRAGRRVVLVSGAYQPVVELFARRIGEVSALGTPLEMANGLTTGRLAAAINTGAVKVERLHHFLNGAALQAAYGDTLPDLPMLEMSRHPVAVYPDEALRAVAIQRRWRILAGAKH